MKRLWYREKIRRVYEQRFDLYGATPAGSFWVDKSRQIARFDVIFSQIKSDILGEYSLADIGCGYGAMVDYLLKKEKADLTFYTGYDISGRLIRSCEDRLSKLGPKFKVGECPEKGVDVSIMSGTYNLAVTKNVQHWESYIEECLKKVWKKTNTVMIFNLQTSNLGKSFISHNQIYYAHQMEMHSRLTDLFGYTEIILERSIPNDVTLIVRRD
tara:strand:+ start:1663 stop:2301 length:639 start_codon:yes stop_codon:yes gene_type:complete